jgi:branched-chain amino acid aminotransferase
MPAYFDPYELLECLGQLIVLDKDWFPPQSINPKNVSQLFVRVVHISTEEMLGIRTPSKTKIFGIISPTIVRPKPLKLKTYSTVFKNWPLGHGAYRVGGNIGPLCPFIVDAKENGFDDIMWTLDGYIKELTF